jgi:hypothetical protein
LTSSKRIFGAAGLLAGPVLFVRAVNPRRPVAHHVGSKIRVQYDTVAGLAGFQAGKGIVNSTHWEMLGLRRDIVPRRKVKKPAAWAG